MQILREITKCPFKKGDLNRWNRNSKIPEHCHHGCRRFKAATAILYAAAAIL